MATGPEGRGRESGCGSVAEVGGSGGGRACGKKGGEGWSRGHVLRSDRRAPPCAWRFSLLSKRAFGHRASREAGAPEGLSHCAFCRAAARRRPGAGPGCERERAVTCQAGAGQGQGRLGGREGGACTCRHLPRGPGPPPRTQSPRRGPPAPHPLVLRVAWEATSRPLSAKSTRSAPSQHSGLRPGRWSKSLSSFFIPKEIKLRRAEKNFFLKRKCIRECPRGGRGGGVLPRRVQPAWPGRLLRGRGSWERRPRPRSPRPTADLPGSVVRPERLVSPVSGSEWERGPAGRPLGQCRSAAGWSRPGAVVSAESPGPPAQHQRSRQRPVPCRCVRSQAEGCWLPRRPLLL